MKLDAIAEGLDDYVLDREEREAREQMIHWAAIVASPCCRDCGYLSYAKEELRAALRRARAIGVFDEQPGEADWLDGHRVERPMDLTDMYLSVEIGRI
jgi:hypothetical protein